jgi:predicted metalloprotease with PDZ domain
MRFCSLFIFILTGLLTKAQNPYKHFTESVAVRYDSRQPVIHYTIRIDTSDLSFINVEMRVRNIADSFCVAMFVHPEYDDRFYRFVEDVRVDEGTIQRLENTLWKVHTNASEIIIHYKIHLPQERIPRAAWRPFLSTTGGLIGGPQSYFYVVGATLAPAYVHLQIPEKWKVATGLQTTIDPLTFFAPTASVLFDSPILIGQMKAWNFKVDDVPHKIVYWPSDHFKTFDTKKLVTSIQKLVEQANQLFGRLPYQDYTFLIQDAAYGALEHANSVTLGITSEELANEMDDYLLEIAHEYFHAWNLVRIRPAEYGDVNYTKDALSKGLWWSEGLTMYYADVLLRRAGIITLPRTEHLQNLIAQYFNNPGNNKLSAELVSMAAYAPPGFSGKYDGSTHLQGELIGTLLDIFILDATNGKKSIDDVMREMMKRFSGSKGFTGRDIENIINEVCGKNVHSFFGDHIRGNKTIDLNSYLRLIGLKYSMTQSKVTKDGNDVPDKRVYAYQLPGKKEVLIGIPNPLNCWGKAGLRTGDELISINDSTIRTTNDFFKAMRNTQIGSRLTLLIKRKDQLMTVPVTVSGYQIASVSIQPLGQPEKKQAGLLKQWLASQ